MSATRLPRWAALGAPGAALLGAAALAFTRVTSPDLGFHLATGRAVRALGRIPATNVLSFTEPDHPWILHEWLPALVFEAAWRRGGPPGVLAVKVLLVVATWSLVLAAARRLGASPIAASLASLLGAGAASTRFSERPQLFSNLALAGCALLLASAVKVDAGSRRIRLVAAAGLVAALAAQVHAGALTSFTLLAAVAAGLALEPARARLLGDGARGPAGAGAAARVAAITAGAAGLAALLLALYHPHGARPLLVPFQLGADPDLHEWVFEFRSPLSTPFAAIHLYWSFAALALALVLRARRIPATLLVPFLVFAGLSLRFVRAVDSFAVVATPAVALGLDEILGARWERPRVQRLALGILGALAVALPLDRWFGLPLGPRFVTPPGAGVAEAVWPTRMFRFIEERGLVGPAFVSDGWAGPYLGAFYPREKAYFDPRFEAYSAAFVREGYRRVRAGEPGWEEQLDRYGVQMVLLKYTTPGEVAFQGRRENLRQLLARSPAWALVGFGDTGELFVRRAGPNGDAAQRFGIPGVDPDAPDFTDAPAKAALGLVRALDSGFQDNRVFALAAVSVAAAGDARLAAELLDRAEAQRPGDPLVREARKAIAR